jgi:hypothetical protein
MREFGATHTLSQEGAEILMRTFLVLAVLICACAPLSYAGMYYACTNPANNCNCGTGTIGSACSCNGRNGTLGTLPQGQQGEGAYCYCPIIAGAGRFELSTKYGISGASSCSGYGWFLDLNLNAVRDAGEPQNLTASAVCPSGASESSLASAFAQSIAGSSEAASLGLSAHASGSSFVLVDLGYCAGGVCVWGGSPCSTNSECNVRGTWNLVVGATGQEPGCAITAAGCTYNPVIKLVSSTPVPAGSTIGYLILITLLSVWGMRALRSQRRSKENAMS